MSRKPKLDPALAPMGQLLALDPQPYEPMLRYFGMDPDAILAPLILHRPNGKSVAVANQGHQPPTSPAPLSSGLTLAHTNMLYPKLTTGAAMLLGKHATRQVIELDEPQTDDYLHRRAFRVEAQALERCHEDGYVLLRHAGHALGLGMMARQEDGGALISSLFPKAQAMHPQRSAFALAKVQGGA